MGECAIGRRVVVCFREVGGVVAEVAICGVWGWREGGRAGLWFVGTMCGR